MKRSFVGIVLGMCLTFGGAVAGNPNEKGLRMDSVTMRRIEERRFEIRVMRAMPSGMGTVMLTTPYSLRIEGDTAVSYLPYFGRAYVLPYGGDQGLVFQGRIEDYTVKQTRKTTDISFNVQTPVDWFDFRIAVYPDGDCYLNIYPNYRRPIGYSGELGPLK